MPNTVNSLSRTLLASTALLLSMWVNPVSAHADYRIFIDFGGAIPVSSTVKGFEKAGECSSFSFEVQRDVQPGLGQEAPKPQLSLIDLTRTLDSASPKLWLRVLNGKMIPTVKITLVNGSGVKIAEYLLSNVILGKYSVSGSGDALPFESFSLSYATIQYTVNAIDPATGKIKSSATAGWDAVEGLQL
jgi:type VI protein secretion system component Hcp